MDPADTKILQSSSSSNPVFVQPVPVPSAYATVNITEEPSQLSRTSGHSKQGNRGKNVLFPSNGRQYPVGRWGDSIFDCFSNCFPSCYCVCFVCCGVYLLAQMAQKVGYSSFRNILTGFVAFCFVGFILQLIYGSSWIVWIPEFYVICVAIGLRLYIINKEQIRDIGCLGEGCLAFWCYSCSVAQMARHVYGYAKVFDVDADPFRPDQYSYVENV